VKDFIFEGPIRGLFGDWIGRLDKDNKTIDNNRKPVIEKMMYEFLSHNYNVQS
jgi:hypothetical protein